MKQAEIREESFLTSYQVGSLLQVAPGSVNKWVKDGRIRAFRTPGGHHRIRAADLVAFLRHHAMPIPKKLHDASKRRLLVVDDDPRELAALERLLKPYAGMLEAHFVDNGIEALVQVGAFRPHVMLLDVIMPGLDGIEVCQRLRQMPETQDIQVIVVSGQLTNEMAQSALEAGALRCEHKPLSLEVLLGALEVSSAEVAVQ